MSRTALTLTQPWASLVILGAKRIETRSWRTGYRGDLLIHAAASWSADDRDFTLDLMARGILPEAYVTTNRSIKPALPLGRVLGSVWLSGCLPTDVLLKERRIADRVEVWELTARETEFGDYSPGRFAWMLRDPSPWPKPEPARGALGLWQWEPVR